MVQDPQQDRRGCLAVLLGLFGRGEDQSAEVYSQAEAEAGRAPATHVYRLSDNFMSAAEVSLFHVLRNVLADRALIFPKVRLADLVYVPKQAERYGALQRINRKHIDFVLCDAKTLRPILALELDDRSHRRPDRIERDAFVDQVFSDSGLPLVHVPVQHSYDSRAIASLIAQAAPALLTGSTASPASANPAAGSHAHDIGVASSDSEPSSTDTRICERCGGAMQRRVATQGQYAGKEFWGCTNYPRCRNIVPISA